MALVGLGVAIDYSLLMIFRFREELHHGKDVDSAIVETMVHAGRSVIVSGSTVAIGLLSMILLPLPFGNLLPGLSPALLGLGWIHKDGVALALSLAAGVAAFGYLAMSAHVVWSLFDAIVAWSS